MKYLACFLSLCLSLCIFQSVALAGYDTDIDTARIIPKSGEPMIVRKFHISRCSTEVEAEWNQQKIKVPLSKIRSFRFLGTHPDDAFDLEVEVTMKSGEKPVMRIKNETCFGETQFGKLSMYLDEMRFLDLDPDPISPRDAPPAPAPVPGQGANP